MIYSTEERSPDAGQKLVGNEEKHKKRLRTETSDSVWEPDWVVGLQILTKGRIRTRVTMKTRDLLGTPLH